MNSRTTNVYVYRECAHACRKHVLYFTRRVQRNKPNRCSARIQRNTRRKNHRRNKIAAACSEPSGAHGKRAAAAANVTGVYIKQRGILHARRIGGYMHKSCVCVCVGRSVCTYNTKSSWPIGKQGTTRYTQAHPKAISLATHRSQRWQ